MTEPNATLFLGHDGEWWDYLLIVSLILAAAAAIAVGITTAGSIISHKREANAAEGALSRYKLQTEEKISEANAREKEAELKLEELRARIAPRHLTLQQQKAITSRMSHFAGTTFVMASSGTDNDFVIELGESLAAAGWKWVNYPLSPIAIQLPRGLPQVGQDMMKGMETHVFDVSMQPVAGELFSAMTDAGFDLKWIALPPPRPGMEKMLHVIIGSK
jgi:hypothetical protein